MKGIRMAGLVGLALVLGAWSPCGAGGNPVAAVAKFRDDKPCAFSMSFDDSIPSQADFVIPHLNARGLRATFLVNPGNDRYKVRERVWTEVCPLWDQELADHTMLHEGAKTYEEAVHQIGDAAEIIWKLYPAKSKLMVFDTGGGTTWGIKDKQIDEIMERFHCVYRKTTDDGGYTVQEAQEAADDPPVTREHLLASVDHALAEKRLASIAFHGVGPHWEWLGTDGESFDLLLDKLGAAQDKVWIGPCAEVYRYTKERDDAQVQMLPSGKSEIRLSLSTPHLDKALFIEPLTLLMEVPKKWKYVSARQAGKVLACLKITGEDGKTVARFDAVPNQGVVTLKSAKAQAKTALGGPDLLKIRKHIESPLLKGLKPSALFDLEGGNRAYVFKGNGKAVAALWHEAGGKSNRITFHDRSSEKTVLDNLTRDWKKKEVPIPIPLASPASLKVYTRSGMEMDTSSPGKVLQKEMTLELEDTPFYLVGKDATELEDLLVFGTQAVKKKGIVY